MNSEEQTKTIDQFDKASVLVIGDLMLDRYLNGTMSRISPEAPAPLIDITSDSFRLGGAANAINNICALGGNVFAVGVVGDDWFGKRLIGLLKQEKVDTSCVIEIKERPTTIKTRVIAGGNYVSLFIGRLDDIGHDGMQIVRDMVTIFKTYNFKTEIIVASVRHPLHVIEAAKVGAHVATIPFNVIEKMFSHPLTDAGLEKFLSDWKKVPK